MGGVAVAVAVCGCGGWCGGAVTAVLSWMVEVVTVGYMVECHG